MRPRYRKQGMEVGVQRHDDAPLLTSHFDDGDILSLGHAAFAHSRNRPAAVRGKPWSSKTAIMLLRV